MNISNAIVLDFEATCGDKTPVRPQEIIEFPSVLVSLDSFEVVDEFESFVRPYHNPQLTKFCCELTSICQADVDAAPYFHDVLKNHEKWLEKHGLSELNSVFITCGNWDLGVMLPAQCRVGAQPIEYLFPIYTRWQNIKVPYSAISGSKAHGMAGMLKNLGIPLKGTHHRGIDDCRNIASILTDLILKGAVVEPTATLPPEKYPPIHLRLRLNGALKEVVLLTRSLKTLRGLANRVFKCKLTTFTRSNGEIIDGSGKLMKLQPGEEILLA